MRWVLISLMIVFTSPAIAASHSTPATEPVTQEELQKKIAEIKSMMTELREELKGDFNSARDEAVESMKSAIESTKDKYGVTDEQLVAIASGAVVGAVVIDLAGGGGIATFIGAILGGAIGNWIITAPTADADGAGKSASQASLRTAGLTEPRILHMSGTSPWQAPAGGLVH
jgi:uncharacterized protein YcfJ